MQDRQQQTVATYRVCGCSYSVLPKKSRKFRYDRALKDVIRTIVDNEPSEIGPMYRVSSCLSLLYLKQRTTSLFSLARLDSIQDRHRASRGGTTLEWLHLREPELAQLDTMHPLSAHAHPLALTNNIFHARPYRYPHRAHLVVPFLQGVKLYYKHQVYGTRPNPKRGKNAVVKVQDLESGKQFRINTEHAVLNVPTEVSYAAMFTRVLQWVLSIIDKVDRGRGGSWEPRPENIAQGMVLAPPCRDAP